MWLFDFYLSYRLVGVCEIELSQIGENIGNSNLVCKKFLCIILLSNLYLINLQDFNHYFTSIEENSVDSGSTSFSNLVLHVKGLNYFANRPGIQDKSLKCLTSVWPLFRANIPTQQMAFKLKDTVQSLYNTIFGIHENGPC